MTTAIELAKECGANTRLSGEEMYSFTKTQLNDFVDKVEARFRERCMLVAWMLKTGHGIKIVKNKPDCEIDLWVPLYTTPKDQTDSSEGNIKGEIV